MLRCLWKAGADIALISGENVPIGRSAATTITSLKCPRHHLDIRYDQASGTATVRVASDHKRRVFDVNGEQCNGDRVLNEGDVLHVLPGKFGYRFEIPAKPSDSSNRDDLNSKTVSTTKSSSNDGTKPGWTVVSEKLLIYNANSKVGSEKIAGFDLDGTLITTKSGRVFPKDADDWKIAFPSVREKLKRLREEEYRLVIFTNQKGISTGRHSADEFKRKVDSILQQIGSNIVSACLVSPGDGFYRKPMIGMWEELGKNYNAGVAVDRSKCLYVGDAAGREKGGKKDHSCADRLFAINLGVKFMTPEEFFLDHAPEPFKLPVFAPKRLIDQKGAISQLNPSNARITPPVKKMELIIFVGYPASGKSEFCKNYLEPNGYVRVSRDNLGNWQKCVKETEKCLKSAKSVVVDNTNPDKESRQRYIEVGKANGATCRCFITNVTYDQAMHTNKFRQLLGADREHKDVNVMVMNSYRSKFQQPSLDEGFEEIVEVNFVPRFDSERLEKLYSMYLLEK